jgi:4-carboxymuconolactone decarboxylase
MTRAAVAAVALLLLQWPVRGATARIAPVADAALTDDQRALLQRPDSVAAGRNELRTYAHHPVLAANLLPFAHYIASGSTLDARDRALLVLRTAWLCRSEYLWAHHAPAARRARLTQEDFARIASGPDAAGWQTFDAILLRVADELHRNAFVSDPTWQALVSRYNTQQAIDAVFTVAEITMAAGTVNSLGVPIEDGSADRLPAGIPYRITVPELTERLIGKGARIPPLEPIEWTPDVRAWLERANPGQPVAAIYRTYARHLAMDKPRTLVSEHIRQTSRLTARVRELLILRIGWLCRSEYEWAAHAPAGRRAGMTDADIRRVLAGPDAPGDAFDGHLLRAVDELHRDDVISDATWSALSARLDTRQLLDLLTTIGGYRMVSMALNTFGVQLEAGAERFPR